MRFGAVEFEHPRLARLERVLDGAVVVAAVATIPLLIADDLGADPALVRVLDWAVWLVFAGEYTLLLGMAPDRRAFVRRHSLAAAIVLLSYPGWPDVLGLVRLARLGRFLRVVFVAWRAFGTLRAVFGRRELAEVAVLAALTMLGGGALLTAVEPDAVKGDYWSGVWWAVVTATTVGYGDVTPSTAAGRLIAVAVMLVGIASVSTFIAAIAGHFVQQDRADELRDIREQLARIEARLEQLGDGDGRAGE